MLRVDPVVRVQGGLIGLRAIGIPGADSELGTALVAFSLHDVRKVIREVQPDAAICGVPLAVSRTTRWFAAGLPLKRTIKPQVWSEW